MTRTEWQKVRDQLGFTSTDSKSDILALENGWSVIADSRESQMIFNVYDPSGDLITEFNELEYAVSRAEEGNKGLSS